MGKELTSKKKRVVRATVSTVEILYGYAAQINPGGSCRPLPLPSENAEMVTGFYFDKRFFEHMLLGVIEEWAEMKRQKLMSESERNRP